MKEGRFRSDLYYRLNPFQIQIPPLRERKEDISRHCRDLAVQPRCAATIQSEADDWRSIQAIQVEGRVNELHGAERVRAQQLYGERFFFVRPGSAPAAIIEALARVLVPAAHRAPLLHRQRARLWPPRAVRRLSCSG